MASSSKWKLSIALSGSVLYFSFPWPSRFSSFFIDNCNVLEQIPERKKKKRKGKKIALKIKLEGA